MGANSLEHASFKEAERVGHDWVGPEHGLLAVLRGDPADLARRAVEEAGLDAGKVEQHIHRMVTPGREKRSGTSPNPAWYSTFGRAEGFAAGLGTGELEAVHLVPAFLWDDRLWQFADREGVSRERVLDGRRRAGASLPSAPMPELEPPLKLPQDGPPEKDGSWALFFCSPPCSMGFAVAALVVGGRVRDAGQPNLAEQFGTDGAWHQAD